MPSRAAYFGAMRIAPSRRIVSPFSIGFSTMLNGESIRLDGAIRMAPK